MNTDADEPDSERGVWETSQFIDEFFKPDVESTFSARMGFSDAEWRRVMRVAREANDGLDQERVGLVVQELNATDSDGTDVRILLTGRAALSKTFVEALETTVADEFPDVRLHQNEVEEGCVRNHTFPQHVLTTLRVGLPCWRA